MIRLTPDATAGTGQNPDSAQEDPFTEDHQGNKVGAIEENRFWNWLSASFPSLPSVHPTVGVPATLFRLPARARTSYSPCTAMARTKTNSSKDTTISLGFEAKLRLAADMAGFVLAKGSM